MCIAAAIIGGAAIGGIGAIVAGGEAASATKSAANTATQAQQSALQQEATLSAPYRAVGQAAIPTYEALLGIAPPPAAAAPSYPGQGASTGYSPKYGPMGPGYPWLSPGVPNPHFGKGPAGVFNTKTGQPTTVPPGTFPGSGGGAAGSPASGIMTTLENLPGYQFAKSQGTAATDSALAAQGLGRSGNQLEAIDQFTTGLAEQNYQSYLQDLLQPVQLGQGAAAGQAANIQTAAGNIGNIAVNQGNNLAGIQANEIAGITRAAGSGVNNYLTYQTLQNLQGGNNPNNPNYWPGGSTPYDPGQTVGAGAPGVVGYDPAVNPGMVYSG